MTELRISADLSFPIDAVTQKFAWLGRTGSGKTYACKRFVEQMLRAKAQVVILDSVGVWFGLRQGPRGFDVPVLGGIYGDIPLDPSSGALVAEVAVSHGASLVLDLSQMSDAGRARFAAAFGARLFELKKQQPGAMHIVLDEGQDYVPQDPEKSENLMLHEWVRIAKQGRAFGMGLSIVSQRPQEISKKALNQAECVLAFQLTGPHERKALEYWLADKGLETKLSTTLTTLDVGRPFVWSPQWLKISQVIERVLPIDSADTSQTPKVGDGPRAASALKPIDLGALRTSMEAATEQAKENDPLALKAEVKRLREQLASGASPVRIDKQKAEALVRLLGDRKKVLEVIQHLAKTHQEEIRDFAHRAKELQEMLDDFTWSEQTALTVEEFLDELSEPRSPVHFEHPNRVVVTGEYAKPPLIKRARTERSSSPAASRKKQSSEAPSVSGMPPSAVAVMTATAQYGDKGIPLAALRIMTGYSKGYLKNTMVALRGHTEGALIERQGDRMFLTAVGKKHVPAGVKAMPRGKALIKQLIETLPEGEANVLKAITAAGSGAITKDQLQADTGYSAGYLKNTLVALVGRAVLSRAPGGKVTINPGVFA